MEVPCGPAEIVVDRGTKSRPLLPRAVEDPGTRDHTRVIALPFYA